MPDLSSSASPASGSLPGALLFSRVQRAALKALIAEAEDGTGCAALTGEGGTGKTAVLDVAAALLGHPPVQVIRVRGRGAPLTSKRLIAQIISSEADDEAPEAIEQALERLLIPASPWTRTILMVDDAHALQRDALAYLQLMCGLQQAPDAGSLQIVFAGRPEFWSLLEPEHLRSLRERIRVRPILPRPVPTSAIEPPAIEPRTTASGVPPAARPGATMPMLPQHDAVRALSVPARRRRPGRRYAVASGFAATVVIGSLGSLSREPPATKLPLITAGYAAPMPAAVDPRSGPLLRPVATAPVAPDSAHAISAVPAVTIQLVAAALHSGAMGGPPVATTRVATWAYRPIVRATGSPPADTTLGPPAAAGAGFTPQADATGSPPAATTPGPPAAAGTPPAPHADATAGPPAATTPGPSAAAGTPPASQADATAGPPAATTLGPSAAAGTPPAPHADATAGPPAATTPGPPAAAGTPPAPQADATAGPPAATTPGPPATAGTPPAPQADATAGPPAATTPEPPAAAGTPPAPQADATAGPPAATTPEPPAAAGTPPAPQADAAAGPPAATTPGPPAAAGTPPAPQADAAAGPPAATTPGPPAAAGTPPAPQADAAAGPPAATTPGPSAAAGTPPAPQADATAGPPVAATAGPWAAPGSSPAPLADATVGPPAATTPGRSATASTPPAGGPASQQAGSPPLAVSAAATGNPVPHPAPPSNPAATAVPQPAAALSPAVVASLLRHGGEMLGIGDIAAARLLFRRAAQAGSAAAAIAIGKTNDPRFLTEIGAQGIVPDPAAAADWYRRAAALGDRDADRLLDGLGSSAAQ